MGARRWVRIAGREGEGVLSLKVTRRDSQNVTFTVLSDTSPMVDWITFKSLSYEVFTDGGKSRISVALEYERELAPAWFFTPAMHYASFLAMDVLARDIKNRAEQPSALESGGSAVLEQFDA